MSKSKQKIMKPVTGYAKGTPIVDGKGTSTSDSIPAKLSKGEAVLPAATVKHFGKAFVKKMIDTTPKEKGAVTKVKDGKLHAAAGIDRVDPNALKRINDITGVNRPVRPSVPLPAAAANEQMAARQSVNVPEVVQTEPVNIPRGKVAETINNSTGVNRPVRPSVPLPAAAANEQMAAKQAVNIPKVVQPDPVSIPKGNVAETINNSTGVNRPASSVPMSEPETQTAKVIKESTDRVSKIKDISQPVITGPRRPDYVAPEPPNYQASSPKTFGGAAQGLLSNDLARQVQGNDLVQEGYTDAKSNLEQQFGKKLPALPGQMTAGTESTIEALPGRLSEDFMTGAKEVGGAIGRKAYDIINPVSANEPVNTASIAKPSTISAVDKTVQNAVDGKIIQPKAVSQNDANFSGPVEPDQTTGTVTQPGFIPSDTGLPYNVAKQANGKNTLNFTNADGTGSGTISGLSGDQVARMRDGNGSFSGKGLMLPEVSQQPAPQQGQGQSPQIMQPQIQDYSGTINDLMAQIPQSSRSDSLGTMVSNKHSRNGILDKIAAISNLQKMQNEQGSSNARLAAEQNQFNQRMEQARTQQERDAIQQDWNNNIELGKLNYGIENDARTAAATAAQNAFNNDIKSKELLKPQVVSSNIYKDGIINGQSQAAIQIDQKTGKPIVTPLDNSQSNLASHADVAKAMNAINSGDKDMANKAMLYLQQHAPDAYNTIQQQGK